MEFMKTNKSPLGLYPSVSESDWDEFCRLKSSEEFQSESLKGQELAKKNKHPHLLGTSGYVGAKKKWARKMRKHRSTIISLSTLISQRSRAATSAGRG